MTWNYRKRISIIPGVHLNISKNGISASIGVPGASVTMGANGAYLNTGIPGSGLYQRQKLSGNNDGHTPTDIQLQQSEKVGNIFSLSPHEITTQNMQGVKDTILSSHTQRQGLQSDLVNIAKELSKSKLNLTLSYVFLYGLALRGLRQSLQRKISDQKTAISQITQRIEESSVRLDIEFEGDMIERYSSVIKSFEGLAKSNKVWDVTSEHSQDQKITRSSASLLVEKKETTIGKKAIPDIRSNIEPLWFKNVNGADLYFYPGFLIIYDSKERFGIVEFKDLNFGFSYVRFIETGTVPSDSKIIDKTWFKVNKNGSPDLRFKDNYQIPIVKYGELTFKTGTGLNESYEFSNYETTEAFAKAFLNFISAIK